jgi:hypothetical protein
MKHYQKGKLKIKFRSFLYLEKEKKWLYLPQDKSFHFTLPDYFIEPGLVISEKTQYRHSGTLTVTDIFQRMFLANWKRIEIALKGTNFNNCR